MQLLLNLIFFTNIYMLIYKFKYIFVSMYNFLLLLYYMAYSSKFLIFLHYIVLMTCLAYNNFHGEGERFVAHS